MSTLVQISNVSKVYERGKQKVEVLHHIDLAIQEGDFLALMGPSGSGKTTLLNLIGGLDLPSGGSIEVGGQRIDPPGPPPPRGQDDAAEPDRRPRPAVRRQHRGRRPAHRPARLVRARAVARLAGRLR